MATILDRIIDQKKKESPLPSRGKPTTKVQISRKDLLIQKLKTAERNIDYI